GSEWRSYFLTGPQARSVMTRLSIATLVAAAAAAVAFAQGRTNTAPGTAEHVVLVTLDGARTEEVFGGLDLDVLASTQRDGAKPEETATYRRFWAPSASERRRKLMPFFWTLVTRDGSIAGEPGRTAVRVRNRLWFSYPGYAEMLLGEPHDAD